MILDDAKWNAFVANPDAVKLQDDPAFAYITGAFKKIILLIFPPTSKFATKK